MTITLRSTKGTALTYGEMDENIRDLYEDTNIDRVLGNGNITTKTMTVGDLNITGDVNITGDLNLNTNNDFNVGDWQIRETTSGTLIFSYLGSDKMKLDTSGNLTVVGNVTGFGTI